MNAEIHVDSHIVVLAHLQEVIYHANTYCTTFSDFFFFLHRKEENKEARSKSNKKLALFECSSDRLQRKNT
jgi:hypothetical protein